MAEVIEILAAFLAAAGVPASAAVVTAELVGFAAMVFGPALVMQGLRLLTGSLGGLAANPQAKTITCRQAAASRRLVYGGARMGAKFTMMRG